MPHLESRLSTRPTLPNLERTLMKWMPPGSAVAPLALFRVIARHPMLLERMRPLGSGLLAHGALPPRVRELLILRTSARCGASYEWGVHVAAFAAMAGLDDGAVASTARARPEDLAPRDDDDGIVLRVADELHDTATLSEPLFEAARARFGEPGLLEMAAIAGFYHLIAFIIRTARVPEEAWAAPYPEQIRSGAGTNRAAPRFSRA